MDPMHREFYVFDPEQFKHWCDSQKDLNKQDYPAAKNGDLKAEAPLTGFWQAASWVTGYSNESMKVSRSVAVYVSREIAVLNGMLQDRNVQDTLRELSEFKIKLNDGAELLTLGECRELSDILIKSAGRDLQETRKQLVYKILDNKGPAEIKTIAEGLCESLRNKYLNGNIDLDNYHRLVLEEMAALKELLNSLLPESSLRSGTAYSRGLEVVVDVLKNTDCILMAYRKVRGEGFFEDQIIREAVRCKIISLEVAKKINQGKESALREANSNIFELFAPKVKPPASAYSCLLPEAHHLPDVAEEQVDHSDAPTVPIGVSGEAQTFSEERTYKIHYPPVSSGPELGVSKGQHFQYDNDQPSAAKAMVEGNPESQSRQWHEMENLVQPERELHGAARDFQTNDPLIHAQPSLEGASDSSGHSFPESGALAAVVTNSQQRELFVSDEEKRIAFENFKKDSLAKKYSFDDMMRAIELLGPDYLIRARDNDTLAILEIAFKCMDQPSSRVNSQGGCRWTSGDSPEVETTPSTNPSVPALTDDHHLATQQSSNQLPDLCSEIETKSTQAAAGNNDLLQVYPQSTPETDEHVAQPLLEPSMEAGYRELSQDTNMPEELMDLITTNRDLKELSREGIQRAWDEKMIDEQTIRLLSNKSNCAQAVLMLRANITHCIEKSKKAEPLAGVSHRPGTFEIPPKIAARGRELGVERADMTYSFMEGIQKDLEEGNNASGGAVLGMQDGLHSSHENIQLPELQQTEECLQQIWKHFNKKYPEYSFEHVKEALQISPLSHNDYHAARVGLDNGLEEVALACVLLNTSGQLKSSGLIAEPQAVELQQTEEHLQQIWEHFNKKYQQYSFDNMKEALQTYPLSDNDYHAARVGLDNGLEEVALACVMVNTSGQPKDSGVMAEPQDLEVQQEEHFKQMWEHLNKKYPQYSFEHMKEALQMVPLDNNDYHAARVGLDSGLEEVALACQMLRTDKQDQAGARVVDDNDEACGIKQRASALDQLEERVFHHSGVTVRQASGIQSSKNNCCFAAMFMSLANCKLLEQLQNEARKRVYDLQADAARDVKNKEDRELIILRLRKFVEVCEFFGAGNDIARPVVKNSLFNELRDLYHIREGVLGQVTEMPEIIKPILNDIYGNLAGKKLGELEFTVNNFKRRVAYFEMGKNDIVLSERSQCVQVADIRGVIEDGEIGLDWWSTPVEEIPFAGNKSVIQYKVQNYYSGEGDSRRLRLKLTECYEFKKNEMTNAQNLQCKVYEYYGEQPDKPIRTEQINVENPYDNSTPFNRVKEVTYENENGEDIKCEMKLHFQQEKYINDKGNEDVRPIYDQLAELTTVIRKNTDNLCELVGSYIDTALVEIGTEELSSIKAIKSDVERERQLLNYRRQLDQMLLPDTDQHPQLILVSLPAYGIGNRVSVNLSSALSEGVTLPNANGLPIGYEVASVMSIQASHYFACLFSGSEAHFADSQGKSEEVDIDGITKEIVVPNIVSMPVENTQQALEEALAAAKIHEERKGNIGNLHSHTIEKAKMQYKDLSSQAAFLVLRKKEQL
ncbi:hypothetical protein [Endozoicomonas sp.]|uniref:hypothetical protein n=1 Tax=Endozoicomonas sp. TaxID=1892382 RepID=UPI003AF6ED7F